MNCVPCCRADTGVLSSFYSYFTLTEPVAARGPTAEEQEAIRQAHRCIQECHVEQLITESKFLRGESLQELLKVRSYASPDVFFVFVWKFASPRISERPGTM